MEITPNAHISVARLKENETKPPKNHAEWGYGAKLSIESKMSNERFPRFPSGPVFYYILYKWMKLLGTAKSFIPAPPSWHSRFVGYRGHALIILSYTASGDQP